MPCLSPYQRLRLIVNVVIPALTKDRKAHRWKTIAEIRTYFVLKPYVCKETSIKVF